MGRPAEPIPAQLTDLYRDRAPVVVLKATRSILGLAVTDRFLIDFPVLIECDGLLILGNVRHCIRASHGGYVLGIMVSRILEDHRRVD